MFNAASPRFRIRFSWCVVALLLSACSAAPINPKLRALSRKEVDSISRALQEAIEGKYTLLKHRFVTGYVNFIGQTLVARNEEMPPLVYQFRVLRTNEVHIFSIPGGIVYVSLGLLRMFKFEAQLAAAIAHELAHQDAGHPLIVWRDRSVGTYKFQLPDKPYSNDPFEAHYYGRGGLFYYGKALELEADEITLILLYRAGYEPRAFVSYLQLLRTKNKANRRKLRALLSVHPPITTRISGARQYLRRLPPRKEAKLSSGTFREIQRRLKIADKMSKKRKKQ